MSRNSMVSGVYAIRNVANGKVYIGSSVNCFVRWRDHLNALRSSTHGNRNLQNSFNKNGESTFSFIMLIYCDPEFCVMWEQIAIDGHKSVFGWRHMFNSSPTAGSPRGVKHSVETRAKVSKAHKGRSHAGSWAANAGATKRGIPRSEETKRKISQSLTGRTTAVRTPEWNAKIGAANKGKPRTENQIAALRKYNETRGPVPDEIREKLRIAITGKKRSKITKKRMSLAQKKRRRMERLGRSI